MTHRLTNPNTAWTVGTTTEAIQIERNGTQYHASIVRAVSQAGRLVFVLEYDPRLWSEPVFGEGRKHIILEPTTRRIIGTGIYLNDALASVKP